MAGTSVPMPDSDSQAFLDNARSAAAKSLRGKIPDSMLEPITTQPRVDISTSSSGSAPAAPSQPPQDPGANAVPLSGPTGELAPPPSPQAQPPDENTVGRALRESAGDLAGETVNAAIRGGIALTKAAGFLAVGANHLLSGKGSRDYDETAEQNRDNQIFDTIRKYVDPAYKAFASDPNANGIAQTVGSAVEGAVPMVLGPAGVPAIAASATTGAGAESVDRGDSTGVAATLAVIHGVAAAAGAAIPSKNPNIVKRLATWVGAGEALDATSNALTRWVLNQDAYKTAVENYKAAGRNPNVLPKPSLTGTEYADADRKNAPAVPDVLNLKDASVTALMQTIFALIHSPEGQKVAAKASEKNAPPPSTTATPVPDLTATVQPADIPPPPGPAAAPPAPVPPVAAKPPEPAAPAPAATAPAVPDVPTAEPVQDLLAQKADAQDPNTPRQGVYLSKDALKALSPEDLTKVKEGMIRIPNFDRKGGVVFVPDSDTAKAMRAYRATEPDMQKVLGRVTGAGDGKAPDQTVVVQGQTPEGAVAKEGAVAPEQVPAAVAATVAEGKTPVVTTPEAAQARRAEGVAQDQSVSSEVTPKPQGANEAAAPTPELPAEPAPKFAQGQRRLVKIAGEDVPVVVAGEAVNGKVPVRAIDDEGRVSKDIRQVPEHMFGEEAKPPEAPAPEAPAEPKAGEAQPSESAPPIASDLKAAVDQFNRENTPDEGRKFAGTVAEHAARVGELARAVKAAAKAAAKDLPDDVLQHALEAAKRVERIDLKTPESMKHNRGVGHGMLDAHAENLLRAADNIMRPEEAKVPAKTVAPKAEALKAKILKAREKANATDTSKPSAPSTAGKNPKERVGAKQAAAPKGDSERPAQATDGKVEKVHSGIKDVEDITKPKKLTNAESRDIQGAIQRYLKANKHDVSEAHDDMEAKISEIYGPDRAHEVQNILQLVREQRDELEDDPYTPKRMSDTVDESEFHGKHMDEGGEDEDLNELQKLDPAGTSLQKLTDKLKGTGFWAQLSKARDNGTFLSTHKILDHLASVAKDDPVMASLIAKLRSHAPDLPMRPVDRTIDPRNGRLLNGIGVHHTGSNTIQILIPKLAGVLDHASVNQVHAILHEISHAASSYELSINPKGEFATAIGGLLAEARERVATTEKETGAQVTHYGLTNVHEFVAEALTNPHFQDWLRSIDAPDTRGIGTRILDAIKRLLGIKDPRVSNLFDRSMRAIDQGLAAQREFVPARSAPEFLNTLKTARPETYELLRGRGNELSANEHMPGLDETLNQLKTEPPALPHDDEFRSVVGDHATMQARLFRRAVRGGAIESLRQNVRSFTSYSQLIRTALRRGVFGANATGNPLRDYHESLEQRNATINRQAHSIGQIVNDRAKLSYKDDKKLGELQRDVTMYGHTIEGDQSALPASVTTDPKYQQRLQDFRDRFNALTDAQKDIYRRERDANEMLLRANRKAAIDASLKSFSDQDIPQATRRLLYSVDDPYDFKKLIGKGKDSIVDVGERNDNLVETLMDLAGTNHLHGDYFHLGRVGDHVVQVNPEGTKTFASEGNARAFAARIEELSPGSKATVDHVGGQWQVDYKAEYVSMHKSPAEAEEEIERLRASGLDVGSATTKILSEREAALSGGAQNLIAEANRRLERRGSDKATKELQETLRQSLVQLMAAKSAYAGSKLARKNVGGVKGEEMGRNFATHAQSMAWNTGHLASVFEVGEALGKLRDAVKDSEQPKAIANQRGRIYDEISRRLVQENQQFGQHAPLNSLIAKAGFLNYMTSFSHSLVYLTQNFSTGIPVAAARHGAFKATNSFFAAMKLVSSPAFRQTFRGLALKGDAESMLRGVMAAVAKDARFGKWAQGENSPLQQLIDRGAIHTSLSNQLSEAAKGQNKIVNSVFEYARVLPSMADLFNRVSTGLAALELHKGDVYRAADFVKETHMDYSQGEKPRAFRSVSRIPFGNSVTMFRTYTQGMAHLLYSHIFDLAHTTEGGKAEALKTVAGLMMGATLFAGVQKGLGLEPIRALMWAYNKIAGDNDEYYSFDNTTRRFVAQAVGEGKIADAINHGLPTAIPGVGFDISSRMGLSDLFYHDPPDISSMDSSAWGKMASGILGPAYQEVADQTHALSNAFATGRMSDFAKALPIKAVQDVVKAYTYATQGATNARGIHLTDPSPVGATLAALGLKTAEQAKVQEQQNTDSDYRSWAENRKYDIIKRYAQAAPEDRATIRLQAQNFSNNNPGHRIKVQELLKAETNLRKQQAQVSGAPSRDPIVNQLNDY